MTKKFYSNGKLLLTGEYGVLDGAVALAVPTKKGQSLEVSENESQNIVWKSFDDKGLLWFEGVFETKGLKIMNSTDLQVAETLQKILFEAKRLNTVFLSEDNGYTINTHLDFPRDWGLGSSSTLLNNIAQWAKIDAFTLLWNAFTGSGYDIACAMYNKPIQYQLINNEPNIKEVKFNPEFLSSVYFIHLNKKQNSRDGINAYRKKDFDTLSFTQKLGKLSTQITNCEDLELFKKLITQHEELVGEILNQSPIKQQFFNDFDGAIKSLGAWGGDFIMAAGTQNTPEYFKNKGYSTVLTYSEMVKAP